MEAGQSLNGRYLLAERLGEGGMSVVWRAHDRVLGREVAVKVLAARLAADADWRRRIWLEARAAACLSHPNITNVYDYGEAADDTPFVVMELLRGPTLAECLRDGPLPPSAAVRICAEVAAGLAAAHAEDLVHRDVKPANVILTPDAAKVLDFGIVGFVGIPDQPTGSVRVFGTAAYLAPERLLSEEVTPASDVYAFGLVLYRCLTGRLPWDAESNTRMVAAHLSVPPEPLPDLPGVAPEVRELCMSCLAKDPADRPAAVVVAARLARAAGIVPRFSVVRQEPAPGAPVPLDLATDPLTPSSGASLPPSPAPMRTSAADAEPVRPGPVTPWPTRFEPASSDSVGPEPVGSGPVGSGPVGSGPVGPEPVDSGPTRFEPVGSEPVGSGSAGSGSAGREQGGPESGAEPGGPRRGRGRVLVGAGALVAVAASLVAFAVSRSGGDPRLEAGLARTAPQAAAPATASGDATGPAPAVSPTATTAARNQGGQRRGRQEDEGGRNDQGGQDSQGSPGWSANLPTEGGVIVAACGRNGGKVSVRQVVPADGIALVSADLGRHAKARVEFDRGGQRLRYVVACSDGAPIVMVA
ncbi:protein kinase [Dactylosporangium sp. NPDC051484]|uniref:serine/threonine-protein kinase n=1 Tax=Dactylosporangium sp. NPDC051484 TaxID=3154942 RepID=UPI00344BCE55